MKLIVTPIFFLIIVFFATAQNAPIFLGGSKQALTVCKNSINNSLDSLLKLQDVDANQTLTISLVATPVHGTVHGFPKSISTAAGGIVLPTGFDYGTTNYYGLDSLTVSVTDGTYTTQTKIIIAINNLPSIASISGNTNVCTNSTTQLNCSTTNGIWNVSSTIAAITQQGVLTTQSIAGNILVSYKVIDAVTNCADSINISIQIKQPPTVAAIVGAAKICAKQTTQFTNATTNGVWSSNDTTIATVDINGWVKGKNKGQTNINYTVSSMPGCSTTVTKIITIDSLPVLAPITTYRKLICVDMYTYVFNANTNGTWINNSPAYFDLSQTGRITGTSVGVGSVGYVYTDGNGCKDSTGIVITVAAAPAHAPIAGPSTTCLNDSTHYSNSVVGGTWSISNVGASITNNGVFYSANTGNYYINYAQTGDQGCYYNQSISVGVASLPMVSPIQGNNQVCVNEYTTLTSSTTGGVWSSKNNAIATIDTNGTVMGRAVGIDTIIYTYTNQYGCSAKTIFPLTVNATLKIPVIKGVNEICAGNTTVFTDSLTGGSWTSNNPTVATVVNGTVYAIKQGVATISYSKGNGTCLGVAIKSIVINPTPAVGIINGPAPVCMQKIYQYTNSAPNGVWWIYCSNIPSSATIDNTGLLTTQNLTSNSTVTINYTVSNSFGCENNASKIVNVVFVPTIGTITGTDKLCPGSSFTYTCSTNNATWAVSNSSMATITTAGKLSALAPGNIKVMQVGSVNGCIMDTSFKIVTIDTALKLAQIIGPSKVCLGGLKQYISCDTKNGTWSSSNFSKFGINASSNPYYVNPFDTGKAYLIYSVNYGTNCTAKDSIPITVYSKIANPTVTGRTKICPNDTTQLIGIPAGGIFTSNTFPNLGVVDSFSGLVQTFSNRNSTTTNNYSVKYEISDSNNCAANVVYKITIDTASKLADIVNFNSDYCVGDTVTFTYPQTGGIWRKGTVTTTPYYLIGDLYEIDSISGKAYFKKTGMQQISYSLKQSTGCPKSWDNTIRIASPPKLDSTVGSNYVCVNKTTLLSNPSTNTSGVVGAWSVSDTSIVSASEVSLTNSVTVKGKKAGSANIIYKIGSTSQLRTCIRTWTTPFTVNAIPALSPIITPLGGTIAVCANDSLQLSNTTINGNWFISDTSLATINSTGMLKGKKSGAITVSYSLGEFGCSNSVFAVGNVYSQPIIANIVGPDTICTKTKQLFTNDTIGGYWSTSDTSIAFVDNLGYIVGVKAGTVNLSYNKINSNNCLKSVSKTITVINSPNVDSIKGNNNVCVKNSIQFTNSTINGKWYVTDSSIGKINTGGLFTATSPGTTNINYEVIGANMCKAITTTNVTVFALPNVLPIVGDSTICLNAIVQYKCNTPNGFWGVSDPTKASITNSGYLSSIQTGSTAITYSVTDSNLCSNFSQLPITISNFSISGNIISTKKAKITSNVSVKLLGGMNTTIKTNMGSYNLDCIVPTSPITIKIHKNDSIKANGVNSVDALLVQRHILNTTKLNNAYKLIAADVDGNKAINSVDVLRIKRLILGTDTTFKNTLTTENRLWAFVDSSYVFPDTTNPFPFKDSISFTNLTSSKTNQTFIGVKLGDVNYDWNPTVAKQSTANSQPMTDLELVVNSEKLATNNVQLTFTSNNFNNIAALQTTLHFDNTKYEFVFIQNGKLNLDYNTNKANETGNIALLWTDKSAEAKNFDKNEVLFTVVLKPKSTEDIDATSLNKLSITNDFVESLAIDESLSQKNITLFKKLYIIQNNEAEPFINVYPNPSNGKINIQVNKIKEIQFTDFWGRNIKRFSINDYSKTNFSVNLPKGIYFVKCISQIEVITKKIIIE